MLNFLSGKSKTNNMDTTDYDKTNSKAFEYTEQVFELTDQIQKTSENLLKEEGLVTNNFNTLLNGAGYITEQIMKVQQHLENLSNNSESTSENIGKVFQSLSVSTKQISGVNEGNSNIVIEMSNVTKMFEQLVILSEELQARYKNVGSFVNVISSIAKNTNLLALNASIEAARAGEQGKGFAVVANEIKKLSEDTQKNAKDIMDAIAAMTEVIVQLRSKSGEGKKMVADTTNLIENSVNLTKDIIFSGREIIQYMDDVKISQKKNLEDIADINDELKDLVRKSEKDNDQFETLMQIVQKKADLYLYVLHHLNQIKILKDEFSK